MIYDILKPFVRLALQGYFKRMDVHGKEHMNYKRLVLVCNHPSALFDPLVVAVTSKKALHFIAGAEWFGAGLKEWFFRNQFNMIPVYRPWLESGKQKDNKDMFRECYVSLEKGESIIIYPEAESITVPWIRELKTGAARIKLGGDDYLKKKGIDDSVKVVPVGLNYTNPKRFQSRLLMNIGEPVDFSGIDTKGDPKEVSREMTARIKRAMEDMVLHVEEREDYPLIKAALKILTDAVLSELGLKPDDYLQAFVVKKQIIRTIEQVKLHEPKRIEPLEERLMAYVDRFEELGFRRFNPFETSTATRFLLIAGVVIGAPFALAGILINGLPFLASWRIFRAVLLSKVTQEHRQGQINPAFAGSLAWATGFVIFVGWYMGIAILASEVAPWWIAWPLSWIVGYQLGRFSLTYSRWLIRLRRILKWNEFKKKNPKEATELLKERSYLIDELMMWYKGE